MKITVINGTEKKGVTYKLKEIFLDRLRDKAEITEFYMPRDCPAFCCGCTSCFSRGEENCKDASYVKKLEDALMDADLLVFTSPVYVFHATGALKTMLDHFGYRWMPHRPAAKMFGKRAVIITQCLGGGDKSTAKDIRDSLSWWGVSYIKECRFKLMSEISWDKLPEKKRTEMISKLEKTADIFASIDYTKPAHTSLITKGKFMAVRMIQTSIGKTNPGSSDYQYWKNNGWLDKARPWKAGV